MKIALFPLIEQILPRRISYRLALSYLVILCLLMITVARSVIQVQDISRRSQEFANNDLQKLLQVQNLALDIEGSTSALVLIFNTTQDKRKPAYESIDAKKKHIDSLISKLASESIDEIESQCLQKLDQTHQEFRQSYLNFFDEIELDHGEEAKQVFEAQVAPARQAFLAESANLLALAEAHIHQRQSEEQTALAGLKMQVIVVSVITLICSIGLAFITQNSVVQPLSMLEQSALQIAAGNYASKLAPTRTIEVERVGHALNTMSDAIALREAEIEKLAYYDSLIALPNRNKLLKDVEHQSLHQHAVLLMDIARLKTVNETLGFGNGDTLIVIVGQRLQHALKAQLEEKQGYLAKFSGGRFALLCAAPEGITLSDFIRDTIEQINQQLSQPVQCGNYSVDVNMVFGIALANEETKDLLSLIRNAEVALYAAKEHTQMSAWYSDAQEASRLSHLSLLSDLRSAVQHNELQMWLQPKIKLDNLSCYGFEALVRWQHPTRGFISPIEFIPFAELTGYINHLTDWMLRQAVQTLAEWRESHPNLSIAVNISTNDLRDQHLPDRVRQLIQHYQIPPANLQLELTESGIMEHPEKAIPLLQALRDIGIGLSIDDFGTGHSSLAYLQKLPVSELKIDRSFVTHIDQHPTTQKLVKTIIEMGHGLNLHVIAEGIETSEEQSQLIELGCDAMQGYFASKPLHGEGLRKWLAGLG